MSVLTQRRILALAGAGVAIALAAAGCAGGVSSEVMPTNSSDGATTADTSGVERANAEVEQFTQVIAPTLPTEPLSSPADLAGKRIVYLPAVAALPIFQASWAALQDAADAAGMTAEICDTSVDPAKAAACLDQAINTGAAAIYIHAWSPALAQQAYDAAVATGIPIILGMASRPAGSPANVVTNGPDTAQASVLAANVIIGTSNGTANIIGVKGIDSPETISWYDAAAAELASNCPGCTLTTVEIKVPQSDQLPSKISAALLANPEADYLFPNLSPIVSATLQGAADAGRSGMAAVSAAATVNDLEAIKNGLLVASVGWDPVWASWSAVDLTGRMLLGDAVDPANYLSPLRVFNAENVAQLDVTQTAYESSAFWGGNAYQSEYKALWQ